MIQPCLLFVLIYGGSFQMEATANDAGLELLFLPLRWIMCFLHHYKFTPKSKVHFSSFSNEVDFPEFNDKLLNVYDGSRLYFPPSIVRDREPNWSRVVEYLIRCYDIPIYKE